MSQPQRNVTEVIKEFGWSNLNLLYTVQHIIDDRRHILVCSCKFTDINTQLMQTASASLYFLGSHVLCKSESNLVPRPVRILASSITHAILKAIHTGVHFEPGTETSQRVNRLF